MLLKTKLFRMLGYFSFASLHQHMFVNDKIVEEDKERIRSSGVKLLEELDE